MMARIIYLSKTEIVRE